MRPSQQHYSGFRERPRTTLSIPSKGISKPLSSTRSNYRLSKSHSINNNPYSNYSTSSSALLQPPQQRTQNTISYTSLRSKLANINSNNINYKPSLNNNTFSSIQNPYNYKPNHESFLKVNSEEPLPGDFSFSINNNDNSNDNYKFKRSRLNLDLKSQRPKTQLNLPSRSRSFQSNIKKSTFLTQSLPNNKYPDIFGNSQTRIINDKQTDDSHHVSFKKLPVINSNIVEAGEEFMPEDHEDVRGPGIISSVVSTLSNLFNNNNNHNYASNDNNHSTHHNSDNNNNNNSIQRTEFQKLPGDLLSVKTSPKKATSQTRELNELIKKEKRKKPKSKKKSKKSKKSKLKKTRESVPGVFLKEKSINVLPKIPKKNVFVDIVPEITSSSSTIADSGLIDKLKSKDEEIFRLNNKVNNLQSAIESLQKSVELIRSANSSNDSIKSNLILQNTQSIFSNNKRSKKNKHDLTKDLLNDLEKNSTVELSPTKHRDISKQLKERVITPKKTPPLIIEEFKLISQRIQEREKKLNRNKNEDLEDSEFDETNINETLAKIENDCSMLSPIKVDQ